MPQKRNPFALAYLRAEANRLLGVQAALAAAARTPSGSMDNRLDAYAAVPDALTAVAVAARLAGEVVGDIEFDSARAEAALADRAVCAADLVARLSLTGGIGYRDAYRTVGRLVRELELRGQPLAEVTPQDLVAALAPSGHLSLELAASLIRDAFDLNTCLEAREDIGGAAPAEVSRMANESLALAKKYRNWGEERRATMAGNQASLLDAARRFVGGDT